MGLIQSLVKFMAIIANVRITLKPRKARDITMRKSAHQFDAQKHSMCNTL